jgi:hypothetical protein
MELTIEKIQEYKKVKEFLDDVCEKYFETYGDDWKTYCGWQFLDPKYIIIQYSYYDWKDQYERSDEVIPMDVLIEFSKKLNK